MEPDTPRPLAPEELTPAVDLSALGFETTADVEPLRAQLGEERALSALRLGVRLRAPGYNVFVAGLEGAGREEELRELVAREAAGLSAPPDVAYVNNFDDPDRPAVLHFPAGTGKRFAREMEGLVDTLREQIPAALKKEGFEQEREQIAAKWDRKLKERFAAFQESSRERGVLVRMSPDGQMAFAPLKEDGEPVADQEEFEKLPPPRREFLEKGREEVKRLAREFVKGQQEISRKLREEVEGAVRKFAAALVEPLVEAVAAAFDGEPVKEYLRRVQESILAHLDLFQGEDAAPQLPFPVPRPPVEERFLPYRVNLLVGNDPEAGAPVVVEDSPTYQNLFGTIERIVDHTGKLVTNFTRIKAGALLRAGGGFLVFSLDDALTEPLVWKPLKRVLKSGRLEIESSNPFALFSVSGMVPEPVPVTTRLIVTGSRWAYALLASADPDFRHIFKVLADFVPDEERREETESAYLRRVADLVRREGLTPFDRSGVEELVRFGVRLSGDREKLTSRLGEIDDLAREASLLAMEAPAPAVDGGLVRRAIEERIFRANWIEERGRELVEKGTLLLSLSGKAVGQVNALSVLLFGGYAFGRPARLTASVSLGAAGIVNIEREAKLSGSTHDKGVLIIAGFLRNRFGADKPLSFSGSLCFEQSYSGIDGDSASSAELYALLSRIGSLPLRQDLAVTGSVNQQGEVQAIGGVNEKIEGFFRTCRRQSLTGTQGVLIPASNVRHLALAPEVVEAVREGTFHVYPVRTIEEGLSLLTGLPAGTPGEEGTVLDRVDRALREMATSLKKFGADAKNGAEGGGEKGEDARPSGSG